MTAAWFISDLHLKDINERSGNILLRFLHSLDSGERPVTHLFLLGDIFDLWVGNHQYFYHKFQPIVDMLVKLRHKGVEIQYFEGNHDMHVVDFWQGHLGIPCWVEAKYVRVGALTLRLEHGDLINLSDEKYLKFRAFMRAPMMESLARILPGKIIDGIGEMASKKSRKHSSQYRESREQELREMVRAHARRSYDEIPFDAIITGHMHIIDDYEFSVGDRKTRSLNLGSWFDEPQALSLIDGKFQWVPLK